MRKKALGVIKKARVYWSITKVEMPALALGLPWDLTSSMETYGKYERKLESLASLFIQTP